jgi:arginyl-tRNA synthetase
VIRAALQTAVRNALTRLVSTGALPPLALEIPVEIQDTKQPEHGDFACNFAMVSAKRLRMNPRQVGESLRDALGSAGEQETMIQSVELAGPGFLNLRLQPEAIAAYVPQILARGADLAKPELTGEPQRINVEFVSVNPNGPITIGSGRGAAFGSTLSNVLEAAGHVVHREYYINDGVNSEQMRQFAASVRALALGEPLPERAYRGEYVQAVAERVAAVNSELADRDLAWWQEISQDLMIDRQREALFAFGVEFDTWFSEQSLHDRGIVADRIERLVQTGVADEEPYRTKLKLGKGGVVDETIIEPQTDATPEDEDGESPPATPSPSASAQTSAGDREGATLWLRSTKFGDDMDRVLRRRDGRLTYIASDIAYHENKLTRPENATKMITILGPDHHGYIGRLTAVVAALLRGPEDTPGANARALAEAKEKLEVVIYQLVRFLKDGKPAPMRKRDGNIYELRDLINELGKTALPNGSPDEQQTIGRDVARFFYLTRSHDTTMDFDIDLATKQSDDNPVFYAQYAHARICSVLRKASEAPSSSLGDARAPRDEEGVGGGEIPFQLLTHPRELALIKKILDLPTEVERCAKDYGVHRLTTYAVELARTYHHFYDVCRVIQPDQPELTQARLALCRAAAIGLRATFALLGVSAPERMESAANG